MLTNFGLQRIRSTVAKMLPDTCQIQRMTRTTGGATGKIQTWTTVLTVPCRFDPAGSVNDPSFALHSIEGAQTVTVPWDTALLADDRVVYNGHTFEITDVNDGNTNMAFRQVSVVEVDAST